MERGSQVVPSQTLHAWAAGRLNLHDGAHLARWSRLSHEDMATVSRASASFEEQRTISSEHRSIGVPFFFLSI